AASLDLADDPIVRARLGLELQAAARYDEAEAEFRALIRQAPDMAPAHYNLGIVLEARGQLTEALAAFIAAQPLTPRDPFILSSVVRAQLALCIWQDFDRLRRAIIRRTTRAGKTERSPHPIDVIGLPVQVTAAEQRMMASIYTSGQGWNAAPQFSVRP